ncbi:MAG: NifU family protein [Planctomycetes bacterium]|nr:NifU family protein [Planctomycetota bacterium]
MSKKVENFLERIRPYLQQDGGNVELINVNEEEGIVVLRLQGACSTCPSATYTLQMGIENQMKQEIPEVRQIIAA